MDTQDFHALGMANFKKDEWRSPNLGGEILTFSLQAQPCFHHSKSFKGNTWYTLHGMMSQVKDRESSFLNRGMQVAAEFLKGISS